MLRKGDGSSPKRPNRRPKGVPRLAGALQLAVIGLACSLSNPTPASAVGGGKSFFFATRDACYASEIFRKWECDNAFANAAEQMRDHAPGFESKVECQLRFQLCERRLEQESEAEVEVVRYAPEMLGVEIFNDPAGVMTAPVLAVANPPGMFKASPIARTLAPTPAPQPEKAPSSILPADRFQPLSITKVGRGFAPFDWSEAREPPASQQFENGDDQSLAQRRERLRSAPFVE